MAGIPLGASYLWWTLLDPFLTRPRFSDQDFVYTASAAIHSDGDPYAWIAGGYFYGKPVYLYPPLWAWLEQPLLPLGREGAALTLLVLLQLSLAASLLLLHRALRPVDRQELALWLVLLFAFTPVFANLWSDQVNLMVLLLMVVAMNAYLGAGRWWGGTAYAVAMALKPLEPGFGLLLLAGRRWWMLLAAVVGGLVLLGVPSPVLMYRYLTKVFVASSGATGFRDNAAPAGLLARLLHPGTFYTGAAPADPILKVAFAVLVLAVVAVSWWRLGKPRADRLGRAAEVAVAIAAAPLMLSIAHSFHLVLLLVPILVLLHLGLRAGDPLTVGAAIAAWLLVGPVHGAELSAIGAGFSDDLLLRIWNESQLLGIVVLWLGALRALPPYRPGPPSPRLPSSA